MGSITVERGNSVYDSRNDCNAIIETGTNTLIAGCKETNIPNSVTNIGDGAFFGCTNLTNITIPNGVTSIGDYSFSGCTNLTNITIPNSVTDIGTDAFENCTGKIIVNCNIGNVSDYTDSWFSSSKFSSVEIGEGVTAIGAYAFQFCSSLTSIAISNSVTNIGIGAFYYCTSLTSITIPESVTFIGGAIFCGCSELVSVTVQEGNSVYDSRNNCNAIIHSRRNDLIAGCKTTIIPSSVTIIHPNAFRECHGLTSISIPNSVTSIYGDAFYGCTNLTSIFIPNSVTSIGKEAFSGCNSLLSITCLADTPPSVADNTFKSVDKTLCTLFVKKNTASLYVSADGWSDFINIVEIEDQYTGLEQIQADTGTETIYDLSGNRVQQLQKGRTYIRNGKKILVK